VLSYIEQLNEVNVDGIEPTAHASAVYNVFRADVPRAGFTQAQATANAPSAAAVTGPWAPAGKLPASFAKLPADEDTRTSRPPPPSTRCLRSSRHARPLPVSSE
jgi:hypothetical protein